MRKRICFILALLMMLSSTPFSLLSSAKTDLTWEEFSDIIGTHSVRPDIPTYRDYLGLFSGHKPDEVVIIEADSFTRYEDEGIPVDPEIYTDYENNLGNSVFTTETALIEYDITVPEAGFYEIMFEYYPVPGKSSAIQRSIFIDGMLPYRELALIELPRVWQNRQVMAQPGISPIVWDKDNRGNDLKPVMVEAPEWMSVYASDSAGYITSPLTVYLTTGSHTLSVYSLREPMLLRRIILQNQYNTTDYKNVLNEWSLSGASNTTGQMVTIPAQDAVRTSSQMLYPVQDQSSPAVTPASSKYFLNNTIGGNSWRMTGQWMEWDFSVPESGFYELTFHARQNFRRGTFVTRRITINGEIPFSELENYRFGFNRNWRLNTLNDDGENYKIYLEAGKVHTLRMEAVLGDFGEIISTVRDCVYDLNAIFRTVIARIGLNPDTHADYQIARSLPELTSQMISIRDRLDWALAEMRETGGQSSERERVLITMRDQLNILIRDNERFPRVIGSFRANIRACGAWLNEAVEQPLQLDTIFIHSSDVNIRIQGSGFFSRVWHEISRLFFSFIIDYNQIGNVAEGADTITLWIGTGRDQANVIKNLIDERFTREYGVGVNVMLVDMNTLLQASLAGQGPDVAIQVASELPMNFGLRGSVVDLSKFDDFDNVRSRFAESAMTPYEFGGATFALPETQIFPMMFYRRDILADLEIELPNTWDEVSVIMSELAFNHMQFGMLPSEQIFNMLLFQHGGQYYNENATRSALDSEEAISAFRMYTEFFTDYRLDRATSVEERFRTGETPIIITDYTFYNNLQISAPELRGVWGFAPVPGMLREDGTIDRAVSSNGGGATAGGAGAGTTMIGVASGSGTAAVMMSSTEHQEEVWQFLSWWTSTEIQVLFGREMESLMGPAARVPTANMEAFSMMPWPAHDYRALRYQFQFVRGIPQVPGGYYTWRNINNAFYDVTTPQDERPAGNQRIPMPREALMDRIILINDEIRYKRIEFGLPLD
ncbi:MAG: extracellular solute-binding protein [Oscillospiraceae bacterium]|jgi:ABC-type glycerol-3-phosphate transport system substrate-binding protein|nr:extracellular solute-binding protein [Oscillospiraceae bacterium]